MIPLIPTLAFALISLTCSAFVILRTVLSVLSPRTLSRRLYPLHYQPPSSRALPPADKSYIWLALCDLIVLGVFLWEAFTQWSSSSSSAHDTTPGIGTTSRLWLALTLRQTCFLIVSALILIHVRMRKSVSFGIAHWLLWVPLVSLATISTVVAGVFATSTTSPGRIFRVGYLTYSSAIAVLNTIMFGCLVGTLIIIRRSLENFHKAQGCQPSNESQAADIEVIREGSAWITSTTSSRQRQDASSSISPSSTRTRHTSHSAATSSKFPFWPPPGAHPYASLPQTPSPRRDYDGAHYKDFATEPFRRRVQSLRTAALTLSSGNSWITSSLGTHPTLSAWSYPTTTLSSCQVAGPAIIPSTPTRDRSPVSVRPLAVAVATAVPSQAEKGQPSSAGSAPASSPVIEISVLRIFAWLAGVWVPLLFALPYIIHFDGSSSSKSAASILLAISVTISSPILAINLLLRHPIPLPSPSGLFDAPRDPHPIARLRPSSYSPPSLSSDRRHHTHTQVNVRAADNINKRLRLLGVLGPAPKLSLLPSNDDLKTPRPPQPSAHTDTEHVSAGAGAGDVVAAAVLAPPKRARYQQHRYRHSESLHHPRYDRARRETKSLSVSFPMMTHDDGDPLF